MKKIIPGLVLCIFISTSLSAQSDSIVLRDVKWDKNSPAGSTELFIPSDNALLAGLIYKPNGAGKHPTLLLLHGYPGNERNLDLAQVVRATGWNVIYFDYRGSWGSQGKFSFMNCVGDVVNVVKFCNKYQDSLQIDTSNIVLFGHSMGGWICLKALQALPQIKKGFALSTWNIYGDYTRVMNQKERTDLANNPELGAKYFVLNASLKEIFEPVARQPDYFNLAIDGKALADKQIIMLDEHHRNKEIADALKLANKTFFKYEVWDTDHPFSNKRVSLMNELIAFLNKKSFVDFDGIDSSIKPGDNFFRYVNGRWYDSAKIAADQAGVGSYSFLNIPQKQLLQHILDSVSQTQHAPGSIDQKVGDFYASGMDTATINRRGYEPIRPILAQIDAIGDVPSLMKFVAAGLKTGNQSIIGFGISPDNKNSSINIAHAFQTGIGLPDRDYYFKTDSPTLRIQQAYVKYIGTLFQLTGSDPAAASRNANLVYGIEKQLAASHKTNIELRDVDANYHKIAIASLGKTEPNLGWANLLANLDAKTDTIDVGQPAYYDKLNELLTSIPISDWKIYLKATTGRNYAGELSKPFVDASFDFGRVLSGQDKQKPRGQIMTERVDGLLGQALGQLYVKRYFNEDAKKRVLALVNNLQKSFENRINHLDWMSDSTKQKAKEKLYAITKKIGYPDKWRDYDKVEIDRNKYFENILSLHQNDYQYRLQRLNKPVDRSEWGTTPSTVTAYYNPSFNEIVFPAGILQFPYFDFSADDAINYGGIGMVIGHEMTHAFDDQGAQFDKDGNVKSWWTKEDYAKFREKTKRVVDLYSSFVVLDSVHVKGALTLGENTADNGGIAIAFDAFKMTPEGQDTVKINGFTPDQRFFLSIARIWRVKTRDAFLRTYVNTNPHSPAMWRVNGPVMSMAPFYRAFNVQPGDKNYLPDDQRIKIW